MPRLLMRFDERTGFRIDLPSEVFQEDLFAHLFENGLCEPSIGLRRRGHEAREAQAPEAE